MGEKREPDFSGWASRNDMLCADGRILKHGAFSHQNGQKVPLMWMHQHKDAEQLLGHVYLEDRPEGVYAYGFFNESDNGQRMKLALQNGDVNSMSIWANKLIQQVTAAGKEVSRGDIKEVSLVPSGANPGATIESVYLGHGEDYELMFSNDEAIIHTGLELDTEPTPMPEGVTNVSTNDTKNDDKVEEKNDKVEEEKVEKEEEENVEHDDISDDEISEVFGTLTEKQSTVVKYVIGKSLEDSAIKHSNLDGDEIIAHVNTTIEKGLNDMRSVFKNNGGQGEARGSVLSHAEQADYLTQAREGRTSLRKVLESPEALQHFADLTKGDDTLAHAGTFGINDIEILFPDARNLDNAPQWVKRQTEWVAKVLGSTKHVPFTRIKTTLADITAPEARARGYIKGNEKVDEVFGLLKRTTGPQTIYKKQKLDRDDILDITSFDVVAWLKTEIRLMLEEEIARAILIGDGRPAGPDKIKDPAGAADGVGIRSIAKDSELYAHRVQLPANVDAETRIDEITRARSFYRGSGSPSMYTTDAALIDMLLLKDRMGRRLYATEAELATVLRVKEIITVEVMEDEPELLAIIVNLSDYSVGTDKGGDITFFSDFDIDFNQEKYLMETRLSGALTRPKSAIVVRRDQGESVVPTAPSFDGPTNTITIPAKTGVEYFIEDEAVTAGDYEIDRDSTVTARGADGYFIPSSASKSWNYQFTG